MVQSIHKQEEMQVMTSLLPIQSSKGNMVIKNEYSHSYKKTTSTKEFQQPIKRMNKDVIIVGAGVAGSALAHTLAKDGYQVQLIERNLTEPNRIVGDLLQPGGYLKLVELGLQDCVDEIDAQRVLGYVIYHKGKNVKASYPLKNYHFDAAGRSFHHRRFVQRLRSKAASHSNVKLEQGTVTSLIEETGTVKGVEYRTRTGESIASHAPLTIVCDGSFSNLRTSLSNPKVDTLSYFVALTLENYQLPYKNHAHAVLEGPSALFFYPISSTEVRCWVDVPGQKLPSISNGDMARYLKTNVAPHVPPEMYDAFMSAIDRGGIRAMPTRSMPASPLPVPGAILVGDALNMRHPVIGGGMMCALNDIVLLRKLLKPVHDLSDTTALARCTELYYNLRKPKAFTTNTTADGFYKLSTSKVKEELRELLFYYMSLGSFFSEGPASLVSGIEIGPLKMAFHFSALIVVSIARLLLSNPSLAGLLAIGRLIHDTMAIIYPALEDGVKDMHFNNVRFPANQNVPFRSSDRGQTKA